MEQEGIIRLSIFFGLFFVLQPQNIFFQEELLSKVKHAMDHKLVDHYIKHFNFTFIFSCLAFIGHWRCF